MKLSDAGSNLHSQFGEDGMIAEIFRRIGTTSKKCIEFGGADGLSCSNTANLWKNGWDGYLIEGDPDVYEILDKNVTEDNVEKLLAYVEVSGETSIDVLFQDVSFDFMSIDVDGNDYEIFRSMVNRPRVICIEYNQSIPPHLQVRQKTNGDFFGSGAGALANLAAHKRYGLVGLTKANLFFVRNEELTAFDDLECALSRLFDYEALTYLATDYAGHAMLLGSPPPWGYQGRPFVRDILGGDWMLATTNDTEVIAGFEAIYGKALMIPEDWCFNLGDEKSREARHAIRGLVLAQPQLIMIDVRQIIPEATEWIDEEVHEKYWMKRCGNFLVLVRNDLIRRPLA